MCVKVGIMTDAENYFRPRHLMKRLAVNSPVGEMIDRPVDVTWYMESTGTDRISATLYVETAIQGVYVRSVDMGDLLDGEGRMALYEKMMRDFMAEGLIVRPRRRRLPPLIGGDGLVGRDVVIALPWDGP